MKFKLLYTVLTWVVVLNNDIAGGLIAAESYIRVVGEIYRVSSIKQTDPDTLARVVADIQLAAALNDTGRGLDVDASNNVSFDTFSSSPYILRFNRSEMRLLIPAELMSECEKAKTVRDGHVDAFIKLPSDIRSLNEEIGRISGVISNLSRLVYSASGKTDSKLVQEQLIGNEVVWLNFLTDSGVMLLGHPASECPYVQVVLRRKGDRFFINVKKAVLVFANKEWRFLTP